jgi:uncharacterized protein
VVTAALERVVDEAGVLSASARTALAEEVDTIAQRYKFDVVIVTQNSLAGKAAQDFADDYFDQNGYGSGPSRDGMLFLITMQERAFHLSTSGSGIQTFTDYGIRRTIKRIKPALREGRYFDACTLLLSDTVYYLEQVRDGTPFDRGSDASEVESRRTGWLFVMAMIAISAALAVVLALKAQLKAVRSSLSAEVLVKPDSFQIIERSDRFISTNTTRTARRTQSAGSAGSTTHTSSSGRSHGGGGGRF